MRRRKKTSFSKSWYTEFSFSGWILKTWQGEKRWVINAIWWNININLQKSVDIRGYELPTNCRNFTQKYLTEVKIFQKSFRGGGYFYQTPCRPRSRCHPVFVPLFSLHVSYTVSSRIVSYRVVSLSPLSSYPLITSDHGLTWSTTQTQKHKKLSYS